MLQVTGRSATQQQGRAHCVRLSVLAALLLNSPSVIGAAPAYPHTDTRYCPTVAQLIRDPDSQTWSAENGRFISFNTSLATHIKRYLGAQWSGVTLGELICLYQPENQNGAFRVSLGYIHMAYLPQGEYWHWTADPKTEIKNCVASDPHFCPFTEPEVRSLSSEELYRTLEQLK